MSKLSFLFTLIFILTVGCTQTKTVCPESSPFAEWKPIYPDPIAPILSYGSHMHRIEVRFYTTNKTRESIRVTKNGKQTTLFDTNTTDLHIFKIPIQTKGNYISVESGFSNSGINPHTNKIYVPKPMDMKFAVIGNIESGYSVSDPLIKTIVSRKPDFVVSTGNLTATPATPQEWVELNKHLEPLLERSVLMIASGKSETKAHHIKRFFARPTNHTYYSYTLKGTSLIFLNTQEDFEPGSAQFNWLTNTLKKSAYNWKIVFAQMPVRSSVSANRPTLNSLIPSFEHYRVNLVFSGGDAVYERFHINGVIYITTGLAGATPEKITRNLKLRKTAFENTPHFLEITLTERRIFVTAYDQNLNIKDNFKIID